MSSEDPLFDEFINFNSHPTGTGQPSETVQSDASLEKNEKGHRAKESDFNGKSST